MTAPSAQRQPAGREESGLEFSAIVAESAGMRHALHMAKRVATTPLRAILLNGEAGTGKELVARCIHNAGLNANAPFVSINCASIPAPLLDVELFGTPLTRHETNRKLGVLELTGRGTVFLDEVGEMPLGLQDRLLRTLEEYSISRFGLGGTEGTVHCRVIAASKTRLEERVGAGSFREELLARLAVLRIELPPLRERDDDVRVIADHMLAEASRLQGVPRRQLGLDAIAVLRAHRWPGNVRELKHVIERAMVVCEGPLIGAEHLVINQRRAGAGAVRGATTFGEIRIPADGKRLRDIEREALELTLQLTDYNQSAAARILCISRPTLARKLRAYGLKADRVE
ncbi:MAG TPA: sigma 54-interacting transcriptional regulator [Gemmatimonadaceae bacterium]|nr:sigma 54-interacting transcriptional regulator [Gemmatimonadaceae bacterium]